MQEEVLTVDKLIKVETCVLIFRDNCLFRRELLLERLLLIKLLGAHKSVKTVFCILICTFALSVVEMAS